MSEPVLLVDEEDGIVTLTLNRPKALNALSHELRAALVRALDHLVDDPHVGAVILTGAGRAFTAGLDLKELGDRGSAPDATESAVAGADVIQAMARCPHPIIGAINGFAVTGGFEIALACDVLICSTDARFADTHARVGVMPGWGLSQRLSRTIGIYRAKELSLTGNYLTAVQAADWGLVNRVVKPDELLPTCRALARDMMSCDAALMRAYKRVIDEGYATTLGDGLRLESETSRAHARTLTAESIATRRAEVQSRGREQKR
jgi:enoyl-CoA hydratase